MNRVLVYCTNNKQWIDYCHKLNSLAKLSAGVVSLEIREESMIEHYTNTCYLKVTPENFSDIPVMFKIASKERIYMCNKDEWNKLAMLNKMGRGL